MDRVNRSGIRASLRMADHSAEYMVLAGRSRPSGTLRRHLLSGAALFRLDVAFDLRASSNLRLASLAPRRKRSWKVVGFTPFSTRSFWMDFGRGNKCDNLGLGNGHIHRCRGSLLGCIHRSRKSGRSMVDDNEATRILAILDFCGYRRHRGLHLQIAVFDRWPLCRFSCDGNYGVLRLAQSNQISFK